MVLPKLALDIDETQYSVKPGNEVEEVRVEAGTAWRRKDFAGAPNQVALRLVMRAFAYNYFMAFWRTTLDRGLKPFLIDLIIDDAGMAEYQAVFVADSVGFSRSGDAHFVTGTLEVKRRPDETVNDSSIVALYDEYGDYTTDLFERLARFANVDLAVLQ